MKNASTPPAVRQLKHIDNFSALLDTRFRIPGTDIRFGLDFLIGLIPYAGDVLTFSFSGLLVLAMARHGASGRVIAKMLGNVLIDTVIGTIPLLGDIFDLYFKANRRNYQLLKEHYQEGKHSGSMWPVVIGIAAILLLMLAIVVLIAWMVFQAVFTLIFS